MSPSALFVVLASGLLALAAWSRLAELYRRGALARAALALGLRFEDRAGRFIVDGPGGVTALRLGGTVGRHLVTDGRVALFEHLPHTATGSAVAGRWRPLGAARVTGVPAFRLEARRPGVFGLTGSVYVAADEVTLDDADDFAERYQLYADDAEAVRAAFHHAVARFFAAHPGYCLEVRGAWLVVDEGTGPLDPATLAAQLDTLRRIATLLETAAADARGAGLA